jgi:hypothetical protein
MYKVDGASSLTMFSKLTSMNLEKQRKFDMTIQPRLYIFRERERERERGGGETEQEISSHESQKGTLKLLVPMHNPVILFFIQRNTTYKSFFFWGAGRTQRERESTERERERITWEFM